MGKSSKNVNTLDLNGGERRPSAGSPTPRRWIVSLVWAALIIGAAVVVSAIINPLLGRFVHWDWMAGLAPASFALFAWALRRRWV